MSRTSGNASDASRTDMDRSGEEAWGEADGGQAVMEAAHGVKQRVQAALHNIGDKGKQGLRTVERQVQERPLLSVATALALGIVIGFLLRRSKA